MKEFCVCVFLCVHRHAYICVCLPDDNTMIPQAQAIIFQRQSHLKETNLAGLSPSFLDWGLEVNATTSSLWFSLGC